MSSNLLAKIAKKQTQKQQKKSYQSTNVSSKQSLQTLQSKGEFEIQSSLYSFTGSLNLKKEKLSPASPFTLDKVYHTTDMLAGGAPPYVFRKMISQKRTYKVVRPMLSCSRAEITRLCQSWTLPVYPDQSNHFTHYSRNRIRKQLLPAIRFFFNPKVENVIFQFTEIVANEQFLINKTIHHLLTVFLLLNCKL